MTLSHQFDEIPFSLLARRNKYLNSEVCDNISMLVTLHSIIYILKINNFNYMTKAYYY